MSPGTPRRGLSEKSPNTEQGPGCVWPPAVPGGKVWAQVSRVGMGLPGIVKDHSQGNARTLRARTLRVSVEFSLILSHLPTVTFMLT